MKRPFAVERCRESAPGEWGQNLPSEDGLQEAQEDDARAFARRKLRSASTGRLIWLEPGARFELATY